MGQETIGSAHFSLHKADGWEAVSREQTKVHYFELISTLNKEVVNLLSLLFYYKVFYYNYYKVS